MDIRIKNGGIKTKLDKFLGENVYMQVFVHKIITNDDKPDISHRKVIVCFGDDEMWYIEHEGRRYLVENGLL